MNISVDHFTCHHFFPFVGPGDRPESQEAACVGPLEQQVQLAPHLLSKAAESSGTDPLGRIQAP